MLDRSSGRSTEAMLMIIGWVLAPAPTGVFALAHGLGATSGGGARRARPIISSWSRPWARRAARRLCACTIGAGEALPHFARGAAGAGGGDLHPDVARQPPGDAPTIRTLGAPKTKADFALPIAVAMFRATSPAMNFAVAIYVVEARRVPSGRPATLAAGVRTRR